MIEPTACAVHAALDAEVDAGDRVAVLGAGTLGLCTVAALAHLSAPATLLVGARYAHQRRLAEALGAHVVVEPDQLARAVRRSARSLAVLGHPHGRGRRGHRLRGQRRVVVPSPGHGAAPGPGGAGGDARPGEHRPGVAVAPRGGRHRGLRLWHRGHRWHPPAHVRHRQGGRGGQGARVGWCRPAIRSSATKRRWRTPGRRADVVPSRWSSTCAAFDAAVPRPPPPPPRKDLSHEPEARIRPRGRPLHAVHFVLARRGLPPRAPAGGKPRAVRARARRRPGRPGGRHPPRPGQPDGRRRPAAVAAAAGHEAHHRLRRHLAAPPPHAQPRRAPAGHRAGARRGRRRRGRRRRAHRGAGPAPPHDRCRAAPRTG